MNTQMSQTTGNEMNKNDGTIYLLHLNSPLGHAKHYMGWAKSVDKRLAHHRAGSGANMLRVCNERGITYDVARTWTGDRNRERQLKNQGGKTRLCPTCKELGNKGLDA